MPLLTTTKAASTNSGTKSATPERREVSFMARAKATTARVDAVKAKLAGKPSTPVAQPVAPRPARTSARAEEMSKLQKYNTPAPTAPKAPTYRTTPAGLEDIPPPPSGLVQQNNIVEAPAPAPEVTREPSNPQTDALARREIQLRKAQQKLKAEQDAWKQEQAKYVPLDRITTDTLKVLAEAGVPNDKLVELQLAQASQDPNQTALLNRIAQLEDQLKGITDPEKGFLAQRDERDYQAAVEVIKNDVSLLVDSNPDFGTIKSEGQTDEVVELITKVFDTEGIILDVEEAAQLVEDKLVERLAKQWDRLSKIDKIKKRLGQKTESSEATPPAATAPKTTLTNAGATTPQLTPRQKAILRVQEAIDAAKRK